jgi:hypothetical protein
MNDSGRLETNVRELLLHNKEAFNLFFEEAKRKGVKLSLEDPSSGRTTMDTMRVQDTKKDSSSKDETLPIRAVIYTDAKAEEATEEGVHEQIIAKLRWNAHETGTARNLANLLARISELGIEDPNSYLSLRDAAQKSGVAERTLRRYIADGQLETEKVKGPRGWEHRVYVPALFSVLQQKAGAFERAHSNPLEEMGREMATLCRTIVEQQTLAERRTNRLLDEIRNQNRVMDELRIEQKEARGQMLAIQDQMVKFLSRPPKKSFFQKLFNL